MNAFGAWWIAFSAEWNRRRGRTAPPSTALRAAQMPARETGMVVGGHERDAVHIAPDHVLQKGPPVDFGLEDGNRDTEDTAAAASTGSGSRRYGSATNYAAPARFFVASVQEVVAHSTHPLLAAASATRCDTGTGRVFV